MNNSTFPLLNLQADGRDADGSDDVSPIVILADTLVTGSGLVFLVPAHLALKRKLFLECWAFVCLVPINVAFDLCDLSIDWCLTETMKVWMKAFAYLVILDLAYLFSKISIYYRAPLVLSEVTLITLVYQSLVYQRDIGRVVFVDAAVGLIALATVLETWITRKLTSQLEGEADEKRDEPETNPDPGTWMVLLVMCGVVYCLMILFPADQESRGTLSLLIHALLHALWHALLSATSALLVNVSEEVPFTVHSKD